MATDVPSRAGGGSMNQEGIRREAFFALEARRKSG